MEASDDTSTSYNSIPQLITPLVPPVFPPFLPRTLCPYPVPYQPFPPTNAHFLNSPPFSSMSTQQFPRHHHVPRHFPNGKTYFYRNSSNRNISRNGRRWQRPSFTGNQTVFRKTKESEYYCNVCNRGFSAIELYNEHVSTHVKCDVEYCEYRAAPRLVEIHYEMQHLTGLAEKIWNRASSDDVKEWISDRKRNYPTAANIERKRREIEERQKRGDVLKTKTFGKMKKNNNNVMTVTEHPTKISGALGNLISSYGSISDESDSNSNDDDDSQCEEQILPDQQELEKKKDDFLGNSLKSNTILHRQRRRHPERLVRNDARIFRNGVYRKPTLLEMLLAPEMRHERNVILQCCRFIEDKNFFKNQ